MIVRQFLSCVRTAPAGERVRRAMADVFARSANAPPAIVRALSVDQPSVAISILEHSPLLIDADLVDIVATGSCEVQCAVARSICPRWTGRENLGASSEDACDLTGPGIQHNRSGRSQDAPGGLDVFDRAPEMNNPLAPSTDFGRGRATARQFAHIKP